MVSPDQCGSGAGGGGMGWGCQALIIKRGKVDYETSVGGLLFYFGWGHGGQWVGVARALRVVEVGRLRGGGGRGLPRLLHPRLCCPRFLHFLRLALRGLRLGGGGLVRWMTDGQMGRSQLASCVSQAAASVQGRSWATCRCRGLGFVFCEGSVRCKCCTCVALVLGMYCKHPVNVLCMRWSCIAGQVLRVPSCGSHPRSLVGNMPVPGAWVWIL